MTLPYNRPPSHFCGHLRGTLFHRAFPTTPYPIIPITGSPRIWRNRPRYLLRRSFQSRVTGLSRYQIHHFHIFTARTSQTLPAVSVSYAFNDSSSRSHIWRCATPHSRVVFNYYVGHERVYRNQTITNSLHVSCRYFICHRYNYLWEISWLRITFRDRDTYHRCSTFPRIQILDHSSQLSLVMVMPRTFSFVSYVTTWWQFIIYPSQSIARLANDIAGTDSVAPILHVWLAPVLVGIITEMPIAHMFGIEWGVNVGFTVVSITSSLIFLCCGALITHITMRMFNLISSLRITMALYTVVIIYIPVTTILLTFQVYQTFHAIYIMNIIGIGKITVKEIIRQLATPAPFLQREMPSGIIDVLSIWGSSVVDMLSTAAFAEFVVQWYGNPRYRTYLAVACSGIGLMILNISICIPLNIMMLYSYIGGGK
jgi:hypothetical protein